MRYKHSLPPKLLQASSVQADTKSWYPHTWPPVARSLSIISLGRYVRFIRSIVVTAKGTAVTHRFNYPKRPLYIFNFYIFNFSLRYGQVGLLQRGFDYELCMKPPPKAVCDMFERYHQSAWYDRAKFKCGDSFEEFFRVQVTDDETLVQ